MKDMIMMTSGKSEEGNDNCTLSSDFCRVGNFSVIVVRMLAE